MERRCRASAASPARTGDQRHHLSATPGRNDRCCGRLRHDPHWVTTDHARAHRRRGAVARWGCHNRPGRPNASVRAALFTGVPYSFRSYGLTNAWEKVVEHPPSSGAAATAPIDDAAAWITEVAKASPESRILAVVHARGGHPPWDVSPKQLAAAPPPEYGGTIEPRTSAQRIAKLRASHRAQLISDADRQRIRALETYALAGQDGALGGLVAAVRNAGLWDNTLLLVTGDVASGTTDFSRTRPPCVSPSSHCRSTLTSPVG